MIFVLIFLVGLPIFGCIAIASSGGYDLGDWFLGILLSVCCIFLGILGTGICAILPGEALYENQVLMRVQEEKRYELQPSEDGIYVKRFYDDSSVRYTFFVLEDKGVMSKTISESHVYLKTLPAGEQAHILYRDNQFSNVFLRTLFFCPDEYFIYIPEGTLVDHINTELE